LGDPAKWIAPLLRPGDRLCLLTFCASFQILCNPYHTIQRCTASPSDSVTRNGCFLLVSLTAVELKHANRDCGHFRCRWFRVLRVYALAHCGPQLTSLFLNISRTSISGERVREGIREHYSHLSKSSPSEKLSPMSLGHFRAATFM
jgi:hypothetical protein